MSVADDRLFCKDAGWALTLRSQPPCVIRRALCLPLAVAREHGVIVRNTIIQARTDLVVHTAGRFLDDEVIHQPRPIRKRKFPREQFYSRLIEAGRADDILPAVALKLRVPRLAL